jgi:hypothetical protein
MVKYDASRNASADWLRKQRRDYGEKRVIQTIRFATFGRLS